MCYDAQNEIKISNKQVSYIENFIFFYSNNSRGSQVKPLQQFLVQGLKYSAYLLGQTVNEKSFLMSRKGDNKLPDTHKFHVFIEELQ